MIWAVFAALTIVGLLLLATAALIAIADTGGMSRSMPTQVPPRRFARYPLVAGVILLVFGVIGLIIP
jgi:hypothetical protein